MIAAGLPVALATDYNPGSSPGGSMPFVMSLACLQMKLLPEEALSACTINAARAMRLSHEVGSVEVGKRADLLITRPMEHLAAIPYSYASQVIDRVIAGGVLISRP
jgi:imidazolonepropionase